MGFFKYYFNLNKNPYMKCVYYLAYLTYMKIEYPSIYYFISLHIHFYLNSTSIYRYIIKDEIY